MMKITIALILIASPSLLFSQEFKRNSFEYEKINSEKFAHCDDSISLIIEESYVAIEQNKSSFAVTNSENLYNNNKSCYEIFDIYGFSLFRNGKWLEGIEIIEEGISTFGSVPELIKRKYEMSMEMAQLGTGQKNVDGSSVYKANSMDFDEE